MKYGVEAVLRAPSYNNLGIMFNKNHRMWISFITGTRIIVSVRHRGGFLDGMLRFDQFPNSTGVLGKQVCTACRSRERMSRQPACL